MHSLEGDRACGQCGLVWQDCACGAAALTESVSAILSWRRDNDIVPSEHMCVHVYHPYRRWMSRLIVEDSYSRVCLPPSEGWYGGWIDVPAGSGGVRVAGMDGVVLAVTVRYCDGTSQRAFITRQGDLVLAVPGDSIMRGVQLDMAGAAPALEAVSVTQGLTAHEIRTGSRGFVHGSRVGHNNGRTVSHARCTSARDARVLHLVQIPERPGEECGVEAVAVDRVAKYAPFLHEELTARVERRFSKEDAVHVGMFLERFFARARAADAAARSAMARATPRAPDDAETRGAMREVFARLQRLRSAAAEAERNAGRVETIR